jgi:hypothetical protein
MMVILIALDELYYIRPDLARPMWVLGAKIKEHDF